MAFTVGAQAVLLQEMSPDLRDPQGGGLGNHLQGLQSWARNRGERKQIFILRVLRRNGILPSPDLLTRQRAGGVRLHPKMGICPVQVPEGLRVAGSPAGLRVLLQPTLLPLLNGWISSGKSPPSPFAFDSPSVKLAIWFH